MPNPQNLIPAKKGEVRNPKGKPKGTLNLETRVRRLLEGQDELPPAIKKTIVSAVGSNKTALDAMIIVGILQSLQGDHNWGKMIKEWGYGKDVDKSEVKSHVVIQVASKEDQDLLEKI